MRRNGQAGLFMVAVSRRGAPGGAVAGALPQTGPVLIPITQTEKVVHLMGAGKTTLLSLIHIEATLIL